MKNAILSVASLCGLAVCGSGCGTVRQCNEDAGVANVGGDWLLSAEGSWKGCTLDGSDAGDLLMEAKVSLPVAQGTGANEATLGLAEPVESPDSTVSFTGKVKGACVDFAIVESGVGYELRYEFEGAIDGTEISGGFTGIAGPCKTEGDFTVDIFPSNPTPADTQDGGPEVDGGGGGDPVAWPGDSVGGDAVDGDPGDTGQSSRRECYTTKECAVGYCQNGQCVSLCDSASDCAVGDTCTQGRCEPAEGCACAGSTRGPMLALLLAGLWALAGRRRR